jgi:hypothetical protein
VAPARYAKFVRVIMGQFFRQGARGSDRLALLRPKRLQSRFMVKDPPRLYVHADEAMGGRHHPYNSGIGREGPDCPGGL